MCCHPAFMLSCLCVRNEATTGGQFTKLDRPTGLLFFTYHRVDSNIHFVKYGYITALEVIIFTSQNFISFVGWTHTLHSMHPFDLKQFPCYIAQTLLCQASIATVLKLLRPTALLVHAVCNHPLGSIIHDIHTHIILLVYRYGLHIWYLWTLLWQIKCLENIMQN